jgi:hypothetical protein
VRENSFFKLFRAEVLWQKKTNSQGNRFWDWAERTWIKNRAVAMGIFKKLKDQFHKSDPAPATELEDFTRTLVTLYYILLSVIMVWFLFNRFGLDWKKDGTADFFVRSTIFYIAIMIGGYVCLINAFGKANEEPDSPSSIFDLYSKKTIDYPFAGKRNFLCANCGEALKIKGKFQCGSGHIPKKERYIFDNCHKCTFVFKNIRCTNCNGVVELYAKNYIEEKIVSMDKEYISRKTPFVKYYGIIVRIILIPLTLLFYELFKSKLYGPYVNQKYKPALISILFIIFFMISEVFISYAETRNKEIAMRNPYV